MQSSSDRGQTEPLAALVAVFALGAGLSIYAGALGSTLPSLSEESDITPIAADRLVTEASSFGAVDPPIRDAAGTARPNGYELNASVRVESERWHAGDRRASIADCERRIVSVRTAPGVVRPGELEVCVWPER